MVPTVPLIEERRGTMIKTMGMMKMYINSRRRVKALKSFLIMAASMEEKPNLPSKPVFGT